MLEYIVGFFLSWFANYSILGVVLALVFGAIWFVP